MKRFNLLVAVALSMLMSFAFTGCKDDDDDPTIPAEGVSNLAFTDTDLTEGTIGGTLSWNAPSSVDNITKYVIYLSSSQTEETTKLGEAAVGTNTFAVPAGTAYNSYILVVACNPTGESTVKAVLQITDAVKPFAGFYILNNGKYGSNNGSISFYDPATKETTADVFKAVNGRGLGDTANDMIVYGNKMYIAVYNSGVIEVTDLKAKSIKQITNSAEQLYPRYLIADGGYVYATLYDGYVAKIDTTTLEIKAKIAVGRNPEQMAVSNGKLYVANSGGMGYSSELGYDKTVSVIDIASFKETKKLDVVIDPVSMQTASDGNVYVISMGNYKDIPNTIQIINPSTDAVSAVTSTHATEFGLLGNTLYMMYSQYDANWNQVISFISFDTASKSVLSNNFITDGTSMPRPFKVGTEPTNQYIYVTESDYKTNGSVHFFSPEGKLQFSVNVGINPAKVIYVKK